MKTLQLIAALPLALGALLAAAGPLDKPECIAPAKPGGGFDLTCKLAQQALMDRKLISDPMRVTYMPGGIGAVAYNTIVAQRPADSNTIVAFSGGSLLNLAQGKFGKYTADDVKWLAGVGADYGVIAVYKDSPYKTLKDLLAAVKADPSKIVFGAGGTVGSQDWMKAALVAKSSGIDYKAMRFVAFEGGGEATTALQGGHVQVYAGDASELAEKLDAGSPFRVLAVMAEKRLPGRLADVPTAMEQGYNIVWPIIRGFYMGPKVSEADYKAWVDAFAKAMATPEFEKLRTERGLYPFAMTGPEFDAYAKRQVKVYGRLVSEFGLNKPQ